MKDLKYLQLFDAYGALLNEHRREVCELYYLCDLSLTEIAEQKGISKQSVSDTLAQSRRLLEGYEQKLHHSEIQQTKTHPQTHNQSSLKETTPNMPQRSSASSR